MNSKQTPATSRRLWRSIPKETRWAMGAGTVLHFGGGQSALMFALCAAFYEAAAWWLDRDLERVVQGLERQYDVELSRPANWRFPKEKKEGAK